MKRTYIISAGLAVVVAAVLVVVFATGGTNTEPASTGPAAPSTVGVGHTRLGSALVGANGHTLYLFEADKGDVSTLSAAGSRIWPPVTALGQVQAAGGAQAQKLGLSTGPGGIRQVTYGGHPLYYYVGDANSGETQGQGLNSFGALWYAVSPSGMAIVRAANVHTAAPSPSPSPSPSSSSYGY